MHNESSVFGEASSYCWFKIFLIYPVNNRLGMSFFRLAAPVFLLFGPVFAAEHVILDCDIVPAAKYAKSSAVAIKRQIKLDEPSSKVVDTETRKSGNQLTREYDAVFSADSIDWTYHIGDCCGIRYRINRSTGEFKSFSKSDSTDVGSTGICKVRQTKNLF